MTTAFGYDIECKGESFIKRFFSTKPATDEIHNIPFKLEEEQQELHSQEGSPPEGMKKINLDDLSLQQLLHIYDHRLDEHDNFQLDVILRHIMRRVHKYGRDDTPLAGMCPQ